MEYDIEIRGEGFTCFFCELTDQEIEGVMKISRESKYLASDDMPDIYIYRICDKTDCEMHKRYLRCSENCFRCNYRKDTLIIK